MASQTLIDASLNRLKVILFSTGLLLERRKYDKWRIILARFVYIVNLVWVNTELIGAVFFFVDDVKSGEDMRQLTYNAPCVLITIVAHFKTLFLMYYENDVNSLIDELRDLESKADDYDVEIKKKIGKPELKYLNFAITLLNAMNIGIVVNFSFIPLVLGIKHTRKGEFQVVLPFHTRYPFDPMKPKFWPFVYVKQIGSACIVLLDICAADYFYYICCTYIRIQFRLLSHGFENLIPSKHLNRGNDQTDVKEKLVKLIEWHQRLISSTNTLETIYTKSILLNFLSSSVIICLTAFNVTNMDDLVLAVSFLSFMFFSLLQIFFLCLFADLLMTASLEVNLAVYKSVWFATDRKVAKDLLTVIIRTQTPCKLTAYGFADVNLGSFSKIISTSWSYFALLNTMYNESRVMK